MSEQDLIYKWDDFEVQEDISAILARLDDLTPAMDLIGEMQVASIQKNFDEQGRPSPWEDLADSTKAQRIKTGSWPGQILAITGDLKNISYEAEERKVTMLPANVPYNAIHHFGGMAGRNRSTKIPGRPYMYFQEEDLVEAKAILEDHAFESIN